MGDPDIIYDVDSWHRCGRGHRLQFYATDEEVRDWLVEGLPKGWEPYFVVGSDKIQSKNKQFTDHPFQCRLDDFPQCLYISESTRWNLWIVSEALSSRIEFRDGQAIDKICSFNGLISLQHAVSISPSFAKANESYRWESSIAIVDAVQNMNTGEIRRADEYLSIYHSLCTRARKDLVYSTLQRSKDGFIGRDNTFIRMTEGAATAYASGFPFYCAPGQRIMRRDASKEG